MSKVKSYECGQLEDEQCLTIAMFVREGDKSGTFYSRDCWSGGCEAARKTFPNVLYCKACSEANCNNEDFPEDLPEFKYRF
ncbi:unnamed protein product [Ceutorhynchus assimilis]|uniref:Uncharacterized protein n=1 Tax=Ceutorhynchus assimilis TaxID=467358 RepID=A0A9N9MD34_9CUCU|nr:unnamed protein product [Ceutorhynchus assimilis]